MEYSYLPNVAYNYVIDGDEYIAVFEGECLECHVELENCYYCTDCIHKLENKKKCIKCNKYIVFIGIMSKGDENNIILAKKSNICIDCEIAGKCIACLFEYENHACDWKKCRNASICTFECGHTDLLCKCCENALQEDLCYNCSCDKYKGGLFYGKEKKKACRLKD